MIGSIILIKKSYTLSKNICELMIFINILFSIIFMFLKPHFTSLIIFLNKNKLAKFFLYLLNFVYFCNMIFFLIVSFNLFFFLQEKNILNYVIFKNFSFFTLSLKIPFYNFFEQLSLLNDKEFEIFVFNSYNIETLKLDYERSDKSLTEIINSLKEEFEFLKLKKVIKNKNFFISAVQNIYNFINSLGLVVSFTFSFTRFGVSISYYF
jgi:hypothetical protein